MDKKEKIKLMIENLKKEKSNLINERRRLDTRQYSYKIFLNSVNIAA